MYQNSVSGIGVMFSVMSVYDHFIESLLLDIIPLGGRVSLFWSGMKLLVSKNNEKIAKLLFLLSPVTSPDCCLQTSCDVGNCFHKSSFMNNVQAVAVPSFRDHFSHLYNIQNLRCLQKKDDSS